MKILALFFVLVSTAIATPLGDFKRAMNAEIREPFPEMPADHEVRMAQMRIRIRDSEAAKTVTKESMIARRQAFIQSVTGYAITYDKFGLRTDRYDVQSIPMTPLKWVLLVLEGKFSDEARQWAHSTGFKSDDIIRDALDNLLEGCLIFKRQGAAPSQRQFLHEVEQLVQSNYLDAGDKEAREAALKFFKSYATK